MKDAADFFVAQVLDIPEHHGRPEARRETCQGLLDQQPLFPAEHVVERRIAGSRNRVAALVREVSAISSTGLSPSVAALSRAFNYRLI
jgi:hypothetical protein